MREDGTEILATLITDTLDTLTSRLRRLADLRTADPLVQEVIAGIHVEGPFLNKSKGFIGAHPAECALPASVDVAKRLIDAGQGLVKLVTLAPECDAGFKTTEYFVSQGVVVSAGHCDPDLATLKAAIEHGVTMFTHLGNGCPMQLHRHDNIIQRALSISDRLWLCFIPDGVHIDYFALQNYLVAAGMERSIFVTDAIAAARLGPGQFTFSGWDLTIGDDLVARSPDGSHFVGSTVTVPRILANGRNELGLTQADLARLLDTNPRQALGID